MNPYKVDIEKLKDSEEITSSKDQLKLKLINEFNRFTAAMDGATITSITGLHKSDISRLRAMDLSRFTIDRLVTVLDDLGLKTSLEVEEKDVA